MSKPSGPIVETLDPPSAEEAYCALRARPLDGVLYFAIAPEEARDDPRRDLGRAGPTLLGRFDLAAERMLPPVDATQRGDRAGTRDLLPRGGEIFFTTGLERPGFASADGAHTRRLGGLDGQLSALAPGPDGTVLLSQWIPETGELAVLGLGGGGRLLRRVRVDASGLAVLRVRSILHEPRRGEIWLLLETDDGGATVLLAVDADGRELRRSRAPIAHLRYGNGAAWWIESVGRELRLVSLPSRAEPGAAKRIALDTRFAPKLDAVEDLWVGPGEVVVTRRTGWVHRVDAAGRATRVRMPRVEAPGGYASAVVADGRLCATYCGGVAVACRNAEN